MISIAAFPQLEKGTVLVAQYNYRKFQFGIYNAGTVICQVCRKDLSNNIVYTIARISIRNFCHGADVYEYVPSFEYDKAKTLFNAQSNYNVMKGSSIQASEELHSVYGDDFAFMCMAGSLEVFYAAFAKSKVGRHYTHPIHISGLFPARHHFLAVEGEYAVHFSDVGRNVQNDIIIEPLSSIVNRAEGAIREVHYSHEEVPYRLLARNRALLVFSGLISHEDYDLFFNNCEHFVKFCTTGRPQSGQVREFFKDAFFVGFSILTKNPQYAAIVLAKRINNFL